jgi:hypothetical protein
MPDHIVVHIEDDAPQWKPITSSLAVAIGEHLSEKSPEEYASLKHVAPDTPNVYPSCTKISWVRDGVSHTVHYWFITAVGVDEIVNQLTEAGANITFVLDVMRRKSDVGLQSALSETLASIRRFVRDERAQVRLFTAYSESDDVEFPAEHPVLFKKGIETRFLLNFLLQRLGFGGA